jgi:DnaJ domain
MVNQNMLFDLQPSTRCKVTVENGLLVFASPYDAQLVASLKNTIPGFQRSWDKNRKVWLIAPAQADNLKRIVSTCFHEELHVPTIATIQPLKETRLLEVHYLGACKLREDGTSTSWGYIDGQWAAIFTEETLRTWFEAGPQRPGEVASLYSVLGVNQAASGEEIKTAFRRMAKQWHPDVCREPDAAQQFRRINEAYQLLSDPNKKQRYDVGLVLTGTIDVPSEDWSKDIRTGGYRSPLRCGLIMADGAETMPGKFLVEKILAWEDITRNSLTLVSSWEMGAKVPTENWI